jgi:hypothetical protein
MTEFPQSSTHLGLPYLQPAQAQKHVTHNEALQTLDVVVHLAVLSRSLGAPPVAAPLGVRYLVPAGATGDWAGQAGQIVLLDHGGWQTITARPGWLLLVLDEGRLLHFDGSDWVLPDVMADQVDQLGIATSADATNRLSVASAASLFTHAGAGHQVKVNKAQATDTASLLFQSGFSGRAEIGLAGNDDLSVKVSADGESWTDALRVLAASGQVQIDTGVQLDGPLTGSAVTQTPLDGTAGRVLRTGDSATLLAASPALRVEVSGSANALGVTTGAGFTTPPPVGLVLRFRAALANTGTTTLALDGGAAQDCRTITGAVLPAGYIRTDTDTVAVFDGSFWVLSRAAERLTGPDGHALRLDCGAQQVWATRSSVGTAAPTIWTFPAPFADAPECGASAQGSSAHLAVVSSVTTTGCGFDAWTLAGTRATGVAVALWAAGRWY